MAKVNLNYDHLSENYLFAEIAHRVSAWQEANPDQKLIRMGIGDVTRPIPGVVTDAMQKAAKELSSAETFRGYGPEQGYDFLRKAVQNYYRNFQLYKKRFVPQFKTYFMKLEWWLKIGLPMTLIRMFLEKMRENSLWLRFVSFPLQVNFSKR